MSAATPEPRLIFLVGLRGSGKSTVARLLADGLGWELADADAVLQEREGRPIREIFAAAGEAGFRDRESAILRDLCQRRQLVLATGGGVVLRPANRALLRTGWVVWLTADVTTLSRRVQADERTDAQRPSLTAAAAGSADEMAAVLAVREPLYRECADLIVATEGRSPPDIVAEILTAWRARGS